MIFTATFAQIPPSDNQIVHGAILSWDEKEEEMKGV